MLGSRLDGASDALLEGQRDPGNGGITSFPLDFIRSCLAVRPPLLGAERRTVDVESLRHCFCLLLLVTVGLALFLAAGVYFWINAIVATFKYSNIQCDVPLKEYVFIQLGILWLSLLKLRFSYSGQVRATHLLPSFLSGFAILVGVFWIRTSKTCPETNPGLFQAMQNLLYFQTAGLILLAAFAVAGACFLRWAFRHGLDLQMLSEGECQQGCQEVVQQLPHVPFGSEELDKDGLPSECVICLEEQSESVGQPVVRTPCGHHFHQACLWNWCLNHTVCPLCKHDLKAARDLSPV